MSRDIERLLRAGAGTTDKGLDFDALVKRARNRNRRFRVAAGGAACVLAAFSYLVLISVQNEPTALSQFNSEEGRGEGGSMGSASGTEVRTLEIDVPGTPTLITGTSRAVWIGGSDDSGGFALVKLDPETNQVVMSVPLQAHPTAAVADVDAVWVTLDGKGVGGEVLSFDVESGDQQNQISVDFDPSGLALGHESVWVAGFDGSLLQLADNGNGMARRASMESENVSLSATGVWTATVGGTLGVLNPSTLQSEMDSVEVGPNIVGMTNGFGYVWLTQQTPDGGFSVLRVQESFPEQEQGVLTLPTGGPGAITTGHGFVWIVHSGVVGGEEGSVSKVEPESNLVTDVVPVGSGPVAVASTPDAVWVANFTSGTVTRIEL